MARLIDRISRSISRESTKSTSSSRNTSSKSSDSKSSSNSKKTTVTPEVTYKPSSAAKKIQEPAKLSTTTQTQKSQSTSSSKSAPSSIAKEFNTLANSIKSSAKAVAKEVSKATVTVSNQVQQSVKKVISHDRESEKTTNKNLTSASISKNVISSPSKMASDVKQVTGNLPKTSTFAFTATKVAYSAAQGAGGGALNYTNPIITKSNDKKPSPQDLKKLVNEYKITDIPTSSQTKQNISNSKQIQIWENAKERNTTPKSNNAVDRFFGGAIQGTVRTGIDFVNGGFSTADWMLNTSAKAKKIQIKTAIDSIPLLPENISNIIKSNIATFQTGNAEKKGEIGGRIMGVIAIGAVGKALAPDILPIFKKNKADYIPETEWEPLKTSKGGLDDVATKAKPYTNSRPSYGKGQVEEVWNNAKDPVTGKVYDPTGVEIKWDPTKTRNGQWDMGHIPGEKYSDMHKLYMDGTINKQEFLDWYKNPANYRPELPSTNRGHKFE